VAVFFFFFFFVKASSVCQSQISNLSHFAKSMTQSLSAKRFAEQAKT